MKAIFLLIGIGILTFGTFGCGEWREHERHEHSGGAYDGYYHGYGHGEYRGYPDYDGYHH